MRSRWGIRPAYPLTVAPTGRGPCYLPREVFFLGLALDGDFFDVSGEDVGNFFAGMADSPSGRRNDQIRGLVPLVGMLNPSERGLPLATA